MYEIETQQINLLVTADHPMYVRGRYSGAYAPVQAGNMFGKRVSFKKDGKWSGTSPNRFVIPSLTVKAGQYGNGVRDMEERVLPTRDYLMLMGAYIADGNLIHHKDSGSYGIDITKPPLTKQRKLTEALVQAGIKFNRADNGNKVRIYSKQLMALIRETIGVGARNKRIPTYVFEYAKEELEVLIEWLMWGDGHCKKGRPIAYTTVSQKLADDVQRLCLHIGKAANIVTREQDVWNLNGRNYLRHVRHDVRIINSKLTPTINHGHVKEQNAQTERWTNDYKGPVYDIVVSGYAVYVRRNGKAVWCGGSSGNLDR